MNPKVAIILLNWNGWEDTAECLESLFRVDYVDHDVIVVDNASGDDSIQKIRDYCEGKLRVRSHFFSAFCEREPIELIEYWRDAIPDFRESQNMISSGNTKLILIKNEKNYGFAEGNNIGMRAALTTEPDYVLLLNNDMVVDKQFLRELVNVAEDNANAGFVGPKIYYYDYKGRGDVINFAGGKLDILRGRARHIGFNEIDEGQYEETTRVDYVEGSCVLVRKDVIQKVGTLNPHYFNYWEDSDWCLRAKKQGYLSFFAARSKVWHKVTSSNTGENKQYYLTRNAFWFFREHASKIQYLSYLLYFFAFDIWYQSGLFLCRNDARLLGPFVKGVADGLKSPKQR